MMNLMDEISELVYVADINTYELLFINNAGKKKFNLDDVRGKKCFAVLQGLDSPCSFCTNHLLNAEEFYVWEHQNRTANAHYLLKDKLIQWEGRMARLEVALDITLQVEQRITLKKALDVETMVLECVTMLHQSKDVDLAIQFIVEKIGGFLAAERVYIFSVHSQSMDNTYEWCAPGIQPQIDNLQGLDISLLDRWKEEFAASKYVVLENVERIKASSPEEYQVLKQQGIQSLVAAPLEFDGKLIGYIGADNPPPQKIRGISPILNALGYFISATLKKKETDMQLLKYSYQDALTGLYNRNCFNRDVNAIADSAGSSVGIVYVDVNGLKRVNDQHGHKAGDLLLVEISQKIKSIFSQDVIYRVGGDEFVIICQNITALDFANQTERLRNLFAQDKGCSASTGHKWTDGPANIQQLIMEADALMYEDKKRFYRTNPRSVRYRHNNDELLELMARDVLIERLANGHFYVYLQSKVDFKDRHLIGAEALIRYRDAEGTIIAPDQFVPLLEDARLIGMIDFYVFDTVCRQIDKWRAQGEEVYPISVNFSRYTILEGDFFERLTSIWQRYTIPLQFIEIELAEQLLGEDASAVIEELKRVKAAGFSVLMNDFSAQYVNLSLSAAVEFNVLKIDKNLLHNLDRKSKTYIAMQGIVRVCKSLGVKVIIKGIETEAEFLLLAELGCDGMQGYLFSEPLPLMEYAMKYHGSAAQ